MPLVLVPTPVGNLGDITLRALEVLRNADLIVAEDTRVTRKLLHALAIIPKNVWSYREQNAEAVTAGILDRAAEQLVALVTDAGMPAISDPGNDLVAAARAAGIAIDVLPGPSAALGVAVLSGFPLRRFVFEGFPPRASAARRAAFRAALQSEATTIWYESPQRIRASLSDLSAVAADCTVFLVREYTKKFEQQILGDPLAVAAALADPIRGEVSFAIAPYVRPKEGPSEADAQSAIDRLLDEGRSVRDIAKILAGEGLGERKNLYRLAGDRKTRRGMGPQAAAEPQQL
ncbi:MAG: 16S rRNA (cytidine(1402)-2'-O)-methyltransferase [Candidatus Baltobacteraceae bacterium]